MKNFSTVAALVGAGAFSFLAAGSSFGAAQPDHAEVLELIRANLRGVSEAELNKAVVDGVVSQLRGRVRLAGGAKSPATNTVSQLRGQVIESDFALFRVGQVEAGLAEQLKSRLQQLNATNKLKGVVLDLRFCDGEDFSAAAAVVDLFVAAERPLLNWGSGEVRSTQKSDALSLPVAVLVNRETVAASEAVAAMFRETGAGLVVGGQTAGAATAMKEFTLKSGQRLQIAGAPVKLGDGTEISTSGVKPDIEVDVALDLERGFREDAYSMTNAPAGAGDVIVRGTRRPRVSESDLVREKREGVAADESAAARGREPEKPLIADPALARAVDILKGLAVVRKAAL